MTYDWSVIWQFRFELARGVWTTIQLTFATMAVAIPGGLAIMLLRQSRFRALSWSGTVFTEFFRNLPLILVIYWTFYILPTLMPNVDFPPFATGLVALALGVSAYNAETFRAGVNSIRRGQTEAAMALGMSKWQVMRKVVFPQAFRRILPMLASTWVSLFKDTSLVSVIAVADLTYTALEIRAQNYRILELLTAMAMIYWCLGYPQAKFVDWMYRKIGVTE